MTRVNNSNLDTQHDLEGLPRHVTLTDSSLTYSMKVSDFVLIVDTTGVSSDGTAIVTLPGLGECAGSLFYICAPVGAAGGDLSLYEKETGAELATYGDLDADDDHVILFSTGKEWRVVLDGVA